MSTSWKDSVFVLTQSDQILYPMNLILVFLFDVNKIFRKKDKGGINFTHTVQPTYLDLDLVKAILGEYKVSIACCTYVASLITFHIFNADIVLRCNATADELIDVIEGNRYTKALIFMFASNCK